VEGRETYSIAFTDGVQTIEICSAIELSQVALKAGISLSTIAATDLYSFIFIVCVLRGKPYRILAPSSLLWSEVEERFGKQQKDAQIDNNVIRFMASSSYCPTLRIHEMFIHLDDLSLTDTIVIDHPWPPSRD
jgi:hypothetical protein